MNLAEAKEILKDHNVWRRNNDDNQKHPLFHAKYPNDLAKQLGIAIDVILKSACKYETAMNTLHQIGYQPCVASKKPRNTRESKMARACVMFLESMQAVEDLA